MWTWCYLWRLFDDDGNAIGILAPDFLSLGAALLERMLLFVRPLHFFRFNKEINLCLNWRFNLSWSITSASRRTRKPNSGFGPRAKGNDVEFGAIERLWPRSTSSLSPCTKLRSKNASNKSPLNPQKRFLLLINKATIRKYRVTYSICIRQCCLLWTVLYLNKNES